MWVVLHGVLLVRCREASPQDAAAARLAVPPLVPIEHTIHRVFAGVKEVAHPERQKEFSLTPAVSGCVLAPALLALFRNTGDG
jgi:hypothetical protein